MQTFISTMYIKIKTFAQYSLQKYVVYIKLIEKLFLPFAVYNSFHFFFFILPKL